MDNRPSIDFMLLPRLHQEPDKFPFAQRQADSNAEPREPGTALYLKIYPCAEVRHDFLPDNGLTLRERRIELQFKMNFSNPRR